MRQDCDGRRDGEPQYDKHDAAHPPLGTLESPELRASASNNGADCAHDLRREQDNYENSSQRIQNWIHPAVKIMVVGSEH